MRVILMEFNELSPPVMKKLMAQGELPNFQRFHDQADVYLTEADEVAPNLEPWIQWVTIHSGIPYSEHRVQRLGDGHKLEVESIWDVASAQGKSVWVCGSMNIQYRTPINGWVVPDPWVTEVRPNPEADLEPYYRFVSANVQEHTREDSALSLGEQARFVTFMLRHGLSVGTAGEIVRQVVSERTSNTRWKRPVILDRVQWDLFRSHWKRAKPDLSTFFINSTAHYQHIYWRHMDPESFDVKPDPAERAIYEDAIPYGYRQMDRVCGRFMDLADDQTTLVFLTALSQEPCLKYEDIGGKMMYRPEDFDRFLAAIGVHAPVRAAPVMGEEFHLDFAAEDDARETESKLSALRYRGAPAMRVERRGANVFSGCAVSEQVPPDAVLELGGTEIPFFDVFYQLDLVKSGIHHPDGMLWIRTPARHHSVNDERVPLVSVAPTVLGMLGLDVPGHMRGAPVGASMQPA